jgi:hypothetical protein
MAVASPLQFFRSQEADMLRFLKKVLMFRVGQKASRGFARSIGVRKPFSSLVGVIGGVKYMRRHA